MLNYDNDESRNVVDLCYRTTKTLINPIIDWSEEEVWDFLNGNNIPHCSLYDEGYKRLGCIGCPMSNKAREDFKRWPKYERNYLKAFERMIKAREAKGLETEWETPEQVMKWWLNE